MLQDEEKVLQEKTSATQEEGEGPQGLEEPTPQPSIGSYYKFITKRGKTH